jgi:hypothetical protein
VPYTTQADEALIANGVPQTATVDRTKAKFTPQIDGGSPDMRPIPDTGLSYVFNSPTPIIMVSADAWYAVQNGVWFSATWALGPWVVATSVPAVIYSIPASSPLHYVTYVQIYNATPQVVVVGYTPGYLGTVVAPGGVVVYGTGYTYVPYVGATVWYPPPVTYGYAANPYWTPWTGWAMGFGMGMALGVAIGQSSCCWGSCPAPYWGVHYSYGSYSGAYWGARRWRRLGLQRLGGDLRQRVSPVGATGAVTRTVRRLQRVDRQRVEHAGGPLLQLHDRPDLGGERGSVQNVYTGNYAYGGRGATYNPNTGVARGGSATVGNAYTGTQNTAKWGQVSVRTGSRPASPAMTATITPTTTATSIATRAAAGRPTTTEAGTTPPTRTRRSR